MSSAPHAAGPAVTVLGIGNVLLGDEGVGVHVIRYLRDCPEPHAKLAIVDGGTLSFNLLPIIETAGRLIVIDAAMIGDKAGAVRCLVDDELDAFLGTSKHTAHEIGLRELFDMARIEDLLPRRRALIGIHPQGIDWGEGLSDRVATAVPLAAGLALCLGRKWVCADQHSALR